MNREARLALESAISDLRNISQRLSRLIPESDGNHREELLAIQTHIHEAIGYYSRVLARSGRTDALTQRVAEAALGIGAIGLQLPQFSSQSDRSL